MRATRHSMNLRVVRSRRREIGERGSLLDVAEGLLDRLDASVDVPSEDLLAIGLGGGSAVGGVGGDETEAVKLGLVENLLHELHGLDLGAPLKRLDELVLGLDEVAIVGIEVLLQDDLAGDVRLGVGERHAPDIGMARLLGGLPELGNRDYLRNGSGLLGIRRRRGSLSFVACSRWSHCGDGSGGFVRLRYLGHRGDALRRGGSLGFGLHCADFVAAWGEVSCPFLGDVSEIDMLEL